MNTKATARTLGILTTTATLLLAGLRPTPAQGDFDLPLDQQIDGFAASAVESVETRQGFENRLGPAAVPLLTKKLRDSLALGASPEGAAAVRAVTTEGRYVVMPEADQARAALQEGYLALESDVLHNLALAPEVRREATRAFLKALRSPYPRVRYHATLFASYGLGSQAIEGVLPLLDDPEASVRYQAAETLASVGDAATTGKIDAILQRRRRRMSAEEAAKDGSMEAGVTAIRKLRNR